MKTQPSGQQSSNTLLLPEKKFSLFLLGIMCKLMAMMFVSCENPIAVLQEFSREDTLSAITAKDVVYIRSDSGRVQMRLHAPLMNKFEGDEPSTEFPQGFVAYFFDSVNVMSSTIRAEYGINFEKDRLLLARRNVEVENFNTQEKLFTETLYWNQQNKTIFTRASVKITSPDRVIYGDSLTASEGFEQRVIHNIKATLEVEEEDPPNE
jgi:LPS export ABC transporter protein LptC